jgi:hypothetical protein
MNLSEHPLAIDISKRIASSESEDKSIPVQLYMPVMGMMMGTVRAGDVPGLFVMRANVKVADTGQQGLMDFSFTADKPIAAIFPNLTGVEEKRIIS